MNKKRKDAGYDNLYLTFTNELPGNNKKIQNKKNKNKKKKKEGRKQQTKPKEVMAEYLQN